VILCDRYRLERRISRTEMAEVHQAVDEVLSRPVAVKLLLSELSDDEGFVARFRREARAAASLNHPNIVSVFDSGEHEGLYFIVMEYVDGPTLHHLIETEAPLPETRAAEIGMEVAAALAAAHQQGIVHRDVKPGNVLLGPGGMVKVVDFGIARAMESNTDLTRPGTIVGSVSYLSPEQALGGEIGPPSDIYSLGVLLYAMVTGAPPFAADTPIAVAHQHVHEAPAPLSDKVDGVSPAFEALVLRCLAKDPADRPPSADAVRQELLEIVGGATAPDVTSPEATSVLATAVPPPPATRTVTARPPVEAAGDRNRRALLTGGVALVLAIAVIALIAAIANQVKGGNEPAATTTVPTTVAPATTIRRPAATVPKTTVAPTTTATPTTIADTVPTAPPQTFPFEPATTAPPP
jgi:serine/threonine-protein kinase